MRCNTKSKRPGQCKGKENKEKRNDKSQQSLPVIRRKNGGSSSGSQQKREAVTGWQVADILDHREPPAIKWAGLCANQ